MRSARQINYNNMYFSKLSETDENQHTVTEDKTNDTNNDTYNHHILLLDKTG